MKDKMSLVQNWFHKAENDLKNAELILHSEEKEKPFDTVCFHCQQAVEKYLKGFLIFNDMSLIKTHNIEVLLDLLSKKYPAIEQFESAVILTNYAVELRYPDDFYMPDLEETKEAYQIAVKIKEFVLDNMGLLAMEQIDEFKILIDLEEK
jgi:HEPN domain-containing protein